MTVRVWRYFCGRGSHFWIIWLELAYLNLFLNIVRFRYRRQFLSSICHLWRATRESLLSTCKWDPMKWQSSYHKFDTSYAFIHINLVDHSNWLCSNKRWTSNIFLHGCSSRLFCSAVLIILIYTFQSHSNLLPNHKPKHAFPTWDPVDNESPQSDNANIYRNIVVLFVSWTCPSFGTYTIESSLCAILTLAPSRGAKRRAVFALFFATKVEFC